MTTATPSTVLCITSIEAPSITVLADGWYHANYVFRKAISVDPGESTIPAEHPILISIPVETSIDMGKIRSDGADIKVVRWDGEDFTLLATTVTVGDEEIDVYFQPDQDIEELTTDEYYVYYGNSSLTNDVSNPTYTGSTYPITATPNTKEISFIRPGEDWINGESQVKNATAFFAANAKALRVTMTKTSSSGIARFQLDSADPEDVNLYSSSSIDEYVYTASDLSSDFHRLKIQATSTKDPKSSGYTLTLKKVDYELYIDTSLATEEIIDLRWTTTRA